MTEINKDYVLRLYVLHARIFTETCELFNDFRFGDPDLFERLHRLYNLSSDLDEIFCEALSDYECASASSLAAEEISRRINELLEMAKRALAKRAPTAEADDADKIEELLDDLAGDDE